MRRASTTTLLLALTLPPWATAFAQGTLEQVPFDRTLLASAEPAPDRFGATLATSGDTLVVTAPSATVNGKLFAGAAYVFVRDAAGNWSERARLVAQDGAAFDQLGGSAVAVEGDTVLLGASRAKVGAVLQQGAVYVFERNAGGPDTWAQTAKLTDDSVGSIGNFGSSIAIEGGLLAVGASRGGGNGQVTIFERDRGGPGAWGKVTAILDSVVADGGTPLESFGGAVALDGDLLLVGAGAADVSFFGEDDGAAYVFRRGAIDRNRWDFVSRVTAPESTLCTGGRTLAEVSLDTLENRQAVERCALTEGRTDHDAFGGRVAIDGDTIMIAAAGAEAAAGPVVGAVHVYRRDPAGADRWDHVARLAGSDILASTAPIFGSALSFNGRTLLVGASGVDVGTHSDQGAVYRFERDAGGPDAWGEVAKIVAGDGLPQETFGTAVALDGERGIVGAGGYEQGRGAVYLAGPVPPAADPVPAFPSTGELITDGVVTGPQGVLLGAVGSLLDEPLPIWIHEVPPPVEPPLTFGSPRGAHFNVGATRTQLPAADMPFGLALPVPPGVDPARLLIAALSPTNHVSGTDAPWLPLAGVYNPDTALFSIALPALFIEGTTVVLVEEPTIALASPTEEPGTEIPRFAFAVKCEGFTAAPGLCTEIDQARINGILRKAFDDFVDNYAYPPPKLNAITMQTLVTEEGTTFEKITSGTYSQIYAVPASEKECAGVLGQYEPYAGALKICYAGSNTPEDKLGASLRHELFHAFQHGFTSFHKEWTQMSSKVPTDLQNMNWIREGTATAAEASGETMRRSEVEVPPLHAVNRALTATGPYPPDPADLIQYSAQDFWVYVGKKVAGFELGLGYLKDLFRHGLSPDAADATFKEVYGPSLADEYWKWVKNQAIEKNPDLDALLNPCSLESPRDEAIVGRLPPIAFPSPDGVRLVVITLPRLTAVVVKFTITANVRRTTFVATSPDPDAQLKYKVYLNGDSGCAGGDDATRTFDSLDKDSVVFVVLANTSHQAGNRIQIALSVAQTR